MKQRANDGLGILVAAILCAGVVVVLASTDGGVGTAIRFVLTLLGVLAFAALAWAAIEIGLRGQ